jgi:hypothetical protein
LAQILLYTNNFTFHSADEASIADSGADPDGKEPIAAKIAKYKAILRELEKKDAVLKRISELESHTLGDTESGNDADESLELEWPDPPTSRYLFLLRAVMHW